VCCHDHHETKGPLVAGQSRRTNGPENKFVHDREYERAHCSTQPHLHLHVARSRLGEQIRPSPATGQEQMVAHLCDDEGFHLQEL
jgi:hypothetical protein